MKKVYNSKFERDVMHIHPGEYFISTRDVIYTILGSCVSVVLYSAKSKIGGMNHFMLPAASDLNVVKNDISGRYGVNAMELLINALMKEGVHKKDLVAKVFGGGNVLNITPGDKGHIGVKNSDFVFDFLTAERIPVISRDVGGKYGRKIYFFPESGKVLLSQIQKTAEIPIEEKTYLDSLVTKKTDANIILFDD